MIHNKRSFNERHDITDTKGCQEDFSIGRMRSRTGNSGYRNRRRKAAPTVCTCCETKTPFNWICRCGFQLCQSCMEANFSCLSCNGITWRCPGCGGQNGLGNQ